jgi:hypothetical protein
LFIRDEGAAVGLDHSCQVQRHAHAERGLDAYWTPEVAVEALLRVEALPHRIWECAAGAGNIVRVLRDRGHAVIASDIHDYGFPLHFVGDFLAQESMPAGCGAIVTNPPFRDIERFVAHAIRMAPLVIMLARLAFYESKRRTPILEDCGLARIWCFRKRLPMLHRLNWAGPKANSGMAMGWFVWSAGHTGPTTISRVSWER